MQTPPSLLHTQAMIEPQEIEEITGALPRVTIPVWVRPGKNLKAWAAIPMRMMLFERAGTNAATVERDVAPDDRSDILREAPRPNTGKG